jgi:hypothetical protein
LEQWKEMWITGIRAAVANHQQQQAVAREFWRQISGKPQ